MATRKVNMYASSVSELPREVSEIQFSDEIYRKYENFSLHLCHEFHTCE